MANLSFDIEGNGEAFIRKMEQMRSSISAVTIEMKNASKTGSSWMNMLGKTFNALGGWDTLKGFASDVIRVRAEVQHLENSFTTLLQSKENADVLVSQMIELLRNLLLV